MREWVIDVLIGVGLAAIVVAILLFSAFDSTFIYRGF
jgi:hypothetical protein